MDIWITSVEWENPSEKLPSFSADNWLKIEVHCEEPIPDVLAEVYQSYPADFTCRLYEPGSTVPAHFKDALLNEAFYSWIIRCRGDKE